MSMLSSARPNHVRRATYASGAALVLLAVAACGAGSEVGTSTVEVNCDIDKPSQATTVNILSYNSTATDPFANALTGNCASDTLTLNHPATDLVGQKQRAVQSLSGSSASYDVIEQFGTVYPLYADRGWTVPLDDFLKADGSRYKIDQIAPALLKAHQYDGKQYGLPTYWSVNQLVYRKDVFDKLGLKPPTTFAEMRDVAQKIQDAGDIKYPLAIPMAPANDIQGIFGTSLRSLGGDYFEKGKAVPTLDTAQAKEAVEEIKTLLPYMSPQALTFSSPEVTTQLQTGQAAMGLLVSGRLGPLVDPAKSPNAASFAFATPPSVKAGGKPVTSLSVDGLAVAANSAVDKNLLEQLVAVGTGEDAAKSVIPAALPARTSLINDADIPFAASAKQILAEEDPQPLPPVPYMADVYSVLGAPIGDAVTGKLSVDDALAEAQQTATDAIKNAGFAPSEG